MSSLGRFYATSIGKKWVVAVTGAILVGFLIVHALGNLLAFEGRGSSIEATKLNEYARILRFEPVVLWTIRLVLVAAAVLHVWTTISLTLDNRKARARGYAMKKNQASTFASRTMIWGGLLVFAFIVFHILHFTTGNAYPSFFRQYGQEDVYSRVLASFRNPFISLVYLGAMAVILVHLWHGVKSAVETLGLTHPVALTAFRKGGPVFAVLLALAFASVPLAVWLGILH